MSTQVDIIVGYAMETMNHPSYFYDYARGINRNPKNLCQAFVKSAYWKAGIKSNYGSADQAKAACCKYKGTPAVGACCYFENNHVALYVGNGWIIHAGLDKMRKTKLADRSDYVGWGWNANTKPSGAGNGGGGTRTVKALFTAYYPANNAMEGGYLDCKGNKLNPAEHTCAAPKEVQYGTCITPQGTGTIIDGVSYRVNDRGGAIKVEGGVYHFDILMNSKAECVAFGRRSGTAVIGSEGGSEDEDYSRQELKYYETNVSGRNTYEARAENYRVVCGGYEITDYVSNLEMSEDINALSAELSFNIPVNPKDKYLTYAVKPIECGDKVFFYNGDVELFRGIVLEVGIDGTVKANDFGYYMNKQEICYQCNGVSATEAIKGLCKKCGIEQGEIVSIPTIITKTFINKTPSSILESIIARAEADQGKNYLFKVRKNALNVVAYPTRLTVAQYRQPYGEQFDVTWLLGGVSGSKSMEDLRNKVIVVYNLGGATATLTALSDAESQKKYGVLQTIVETESSANAKSLAQAKLKELNVLTESYAVDEMLGSDAVISGVIMEFSSDEYGLTGYHLVKSVKHSYQPRHMMSLELLKVVKPS